MGSSYTPGGTVVTPSTDNALARYDGTTGIQGSTALLDDSGNLDLGGHFISSVGQITTDSIRTNAGAGMFLDSVGVGTLRFRDTNLSFSSTIAIIGNDQIGMRNSTNGQTWIVYRTFTDASNFSQFATVVTGSTVDFVRQEAGSGIGVLSGYTFDGPVAIPTLSVGGGTIIAKIAVFTGSFSGSSVGAGTTATETFTATGVTASDQVALSFDAQVPGLVFVSVKCGTDSITLTFYNVDLLNPHTITGAFSARSFET